MHYQVLTGVSTLVPLSISIYDTLKVHPSSACGCMRVCKIKRFNTYIHSELIVTTKPISSFYTVVILHKVKYLISNSG